MSTTSRTTTTTTTTVGLAVSGAAFTAYPLLRPYGPESGLAGAADFGSGLWLAAHVFGMLGLVFLAFALRAAAYASPWPWSGRPIRELETRMWLAVALLLPYYGAEAYGLNELGRYALTEQEPAVLAVANAFRYAPFQVVTFGLGLLVLVLVGGRVVHGLWRSGPVGRTGGLFAGLALATYLPQFFGTPELRITHGAVLGVGLLLMAVAAHKPAVATTSPSLRGEEQTLAA